jgi:hypothetical protein
VPDCISATASAYQKPQHRTQAKRLVTIALCLSHCSTKSAIPNQSLPLPFHPHSGIVHFTLRHIHPENKFTIKLAEYLVADFIYFWY